MDFRKNFQEGFIAIIMNEPTSEPKSELVDNAKKTGKNVLICSAPPHILKVLNSAKALGRVEQKYYFDVINDAVSMANELSVAKNVCLR